MNMRKLIRGKAIGAQPFFFDTFNAIVDFVRNLKGDKDVNSSTGEVELDRTDPSHPVIRFSGKASGGDVEVGEPKVVVSGVEWVGSDHEDFGIHPYTFKIVRGVVQIEGGELTIVPDEGLAPAQYLATTPLSQEATP